MDFRDENAIRALLQEELQPIKDMLAALAGASGTIDQISSSVGRVERTVDSTAVQVEKIAETITPSAALNNYLKSINVVDVTFVSGCLNAARTLAFGYREPITIEEAETFLKAHPNFATFVIDTAFERASMPRRAMAVISYIAHSQGMEALFGRFFAAMIDNTSLDPIAVRFREMVATKEINERKWEECLWQTANAFLAFTLNQPMPTEFKPVTIGGWGPAQFVTKGASA